LEGALAYRWIYGGQQFPGGNVSGQSGLGDHRQPFFESDSVFHLASRVPFSFTLLTNRLLGETAEGHESCFLAFT
jgi:hypothetical protein